VRDCLLGSPPSYKCFRLWFTTSTSGRRLVGYISVEVLLVHDPSRSKRQSEAGEANHIEKLPWQWQFGPPKEVDPAPDRPPIIFLSQYGRPGDYDSLARPADPFKQPEVLQAPRSLSAGAPASPAPGADDGDEELVVVRGKPGRRRADGRICDTSGGCLGRHPCPVAISLTAGQTVAALFLVNSAGTARLTGGEIFCFRAGR